MEDSFFRYIVVVAIFFICIAITVFALIKGKHISDSDFYDDDGNHIYYDRRVINHDEEEFIEEDNDDDFINNSNLN